MRRTNAIVVVLVGLLALAGSADAARQGGHNASTRKLEKGFKWLNTFRVGSEEGCYPSASRSAGIVRRKAHLSTAVTGGFGGVRSDGRVYVLRGLTNCNRVVLSLRTGGKVFVLNSLRGPVYVLGSKQNEEPQAGGRGPLRDVNTISRGFSFRKSHEIVRMQVICPKGTYPLSGGATSFPSVGPDGEGVYPHSYERLGVQHGFHVTSSLVDPVDGATHRETVVQAICARGLVPFSAPHKTVFVRRNSANTVRASCRKGQKLFSGGFQRTNFGTPLGTYGGNYITESRAISATTWQVSAAAAGHDGGELTAIAYCAKDPSLPLKEVSASAPLPSPAPLPASTATTATTPQCPPGLTMIAGGFSFNGSRNGLFADGTFNQDGTWSATGYAYFGQVDPPGLTAYGYCAQAG
jgi:hypothetical protein